MAEMVNLRMARKRKVRAEKEAAADRNRVTHGVSRAEKEMARARREDAIRKLEGHRLPNSPKST